jgi:hypothetical protein
MLRDTRHIAEAYATQMPAVSVPDATGPSITAKTGVPPTASLNQSNEEPKKVVKDWLRLEPGLYPIDTVRKADHTAHVILQFIYSICASPDAVARVMKTVNKAYKQDHK